ncbi:(deoxy)nucleoside triphosphate pyrophosphohydrolase [Corallincola platygyrae]|uniref:8-oxo-dGTP diphosphatase n=1 Tax=Corallincola platygyrae TaxID=1193278 RepID=A0ABW4XRY7_9GAMM
MLEVVAAVLINEQGKWLIAQRPAHKVRAGLWEFPGGKVEKEETPEQALIRELEEEFGFTPITNHFTHLCSVDHSYSDLDLKLHSYSLVVGAVNIEPKEHQAIAWVDRETIGDYHISAADSATVDKLNEIDC